MTVPFPVNIATFIMSGGPKKTIYIPQVVQMANEQLEIYINHEIIKEAEKMIEQQDGNIGGPSVEEILGTYELKNNQRNVLSLSLSNYTYHAHAAHGMTVLQSLTFDLLKGKRCELKDLFKPGSDYVKQLSAIIQKQIKERDIPLINEFNAIGPNQDFYVADKILVIYFQLYELTPYVYGFPMFPISVYELQDIIDENGPLGRLAENN
ncbi:DUF3298 and DUF4163 domain-containing protein [Lysinibacillus odysseyi]|uniref:DUF3298 domain-containing protein n=1 Tax=Lysinibacillus odysseyi 34hs-1 = NBRC 100172 TaxID=1220589 RepID=A0A0A3ILX5_9BACI|nr:DUF3298 and DUF4163 domain-containing protein [Lysinibacillus odysseyi]KGR84490.1 hypothetical protein CD32_12990 [Lysinibacillus odysseyi 34hs-1 = NBRC 100172]